MLQHSHTIPSNGDGVCRWKEGLRSFRQSDGTTKFANTSLGSPVSRFPCQTVEPAAWPGNRLTLKAPIEERARQMNDRSLVGARSRQLASQEVDAAGPWMTTFS
jgi:hypothetical protein